MASHRDELPAGKKGNVLDRSAAPQRFEAGTQPVAAGFMANAWIRMKHPDFDTLRHMLDEVGRTVHVYAG
mgnify:CR=1 FL=1